MIKILALISISLGLSHAAIVQEGVYVLGKDSKVISLIQGHPELSIDHMSSQGFELYGPKGTKAWLEAMKIEYKETDFFSDPKSSGYRKELLGYPSFEQITANLFALAKKYPKIMKVFSIGKSVQGRDLWMVKISDNVEKDETEPEFKYISSMHGDEITGRELTQFWIKDLVEGYGKSSNITSLINNTEIYVMPSMNPDGSKRRVRGNANWVDLNRNFPDWTSAEANNPEGREVETKAIMAFQDRRQFALSANFHGGAVVVNYPWDSTYDRHPFDELIKDFSLAYAQTNPGMRNSSEFQDGVTNGADWYKVVGGMQDWSYVWHNDLQVTIELSERKWPSYRDIPSFYEDNKESMFTLAELIHQGAGFKLSDSAAEGRVEIMKVEGSIKKDMGSYGFRGGEFYKVLEPGKYLFSVEVEGRKESFEAIVEEDVISENGNYTKI